MESFIIIIIIVFVVKFLFLFSQTLSQRFIQD